MYGQTDGGDCITTLANAVGNYNKLLQSCYQQVTFRPPKNYHFLWGIWARRNNRSLGPWVPTLNGIMIGWAVFARLTG